MQLLLFHYLEVFASVQAVAKLRSVIRFGVCKVLITDKYLIIIIRYYFKHATTDGY